MEDIKRVTGIKYGRFILQTCPPTHLGPENAGGCPHWMFMYVCMYVYIYIHFFAYNISGWWYTYPSGKYESQLGLLFPIYGKIKK